MMFSFTGWLLLLSIPAGPLFFLLSGIDGGTSLFYLVIMAAALFIYPYLGTALAGLAHSLITLADPPQHK